MSLSQKEKEEVLTITVVVEIHAVVMVVEIAVVEKTVVVETEEDINIPFYNYKKRCQFKLTPFLYYISCKILTMKRTKEGLFSFDYNGHFAVYRVSFAGTPNNPQFFYILLIAILYRN
jgi:hypothetical protein